MTDNNTKAPETLPDGWQYSTLPERRLAWLEQEHERLKERLAGADDRYQGVLALSKEWQQRYQMVSRLHDQARLATEIDGLKSAYTYLRQMAVTVTAFPSKYRREGALQLLDAIPEHIKRLESIHAHKEQYLS
jgi:hypothetical protein